MKKLCFALFLISSPAAAQQPQDDALWRQLISNREAQCSQQIVDLARQLTKAREEIANLQSKLAEKDKK